MNSNNQAKMPVKTPGPTGAKEDARLSISRGKQDGRYHVVTKDLDLTIRLLVMRDGRPPHQQVRNLLESSLSKVRGTVTNDLSKAVHVWAGKVIAYYKYISLKEMKVKKYIFFFLPPIISPLRAPNSISPYFY